MKIRSRLRDERGYVIALVSISAMAIILLVGFSVDLGSWYLRATKLQRAADAAALAGAVSLPDTESAVGEAQATFDHNGFQNAGSISSGATLSGNAIKATVTDDSVPTYFVHLILKSVKISRSSYAVRSTNIPLGSPFNVFGTGDLALAGPDNVPKQGFWAAVNGPCSAREDGDYFLARYDLNEPPSGSKCNGGGASIPNPNYGTGGGYMYAVDVPAGQTNAVDIDAYDAPFEWDVNGNVTNDNIGGVPTDSDSGDMDTVFIVWNTNGSKKQSDWSAESKIKYLDGNEAFRNKWAKLYTVPAGSTARQYVVQVYTLESPGIAINTGANSFSLIARPTNEPDSASGSTPYACDGRLHPNTCPVTYAVNAVSSFNNVSGGKTDFYLASLDASFSGGTVTVYLWDPGEGTNSIAFLPPYSNTPTTFDWASSDGSSGNGATSLDVSGPGPPNANLHGSGRFNDQLLTLTVHIPSDYASHIPPGGDTWWKMEYNAGASKVTDRITWGVNAGGGAGSPAHLVSGF